MSQDLPDLTRRVLERCSELGFAAAGVCDAEPSRWADEFRAWLERGEHGTMRWLAERVEVRTDVRALLTGARSVIMVADQYAEHGDRAEPKPGVGRVARYARGRDYHVILKKRLHALCDELRALSPNAEFRAFVDTAPVLERELAQRCGIGWQGKHTLTIHPKLGSYFLLGGIVTTLELAAVPGQAVVTDHCGTCTRCIDACPTGAITPYSVDARRCVSYLTIEHRERIDQEFFEGIGDWLFGCDVCQEVCPHNRPRVGVDARVNESYASRLEAGAAGFDLLALLGWSEEDRRAAFSGSSMKRAKLDMVRRNAVIVAGNQLAAEKDEKLRARVEEIAADATEPALVRDTAAEVLKRLDEQ